MEARDEPAYLSPDVFVPALQATDKWEAIHEILGHFHGHPHVKNLGDWEADVAQREKLCPTVLRPGIALPHARTRAVSQLTWALAVSPSGIPFDPEPSAPRARLIILVGTPPSRVKPYLEFVSNLTRWFRSGTPALDQNLEQNPELAAVLSELRGAEHPALSQAI